MKSIHHWCCYIGVSLYFSVSKNRSLSVQSMHHNSQIKLWQNKRPLQTSVHACDVTLWKFKQHAIKQVQWLGCSVSLYHTCAKSPSKKRILRLYELLCASSSIALWVTWTEESSFNKLTFYHHHGIIFSILSMTHPNHTPTSLLQHPPLPLPISNPHPNPNPPFPFSLHGLNCFRCTFLYVVIMNQNTQEVKMNAV